MKQMIGGAGTDTTAAALTFLRTNNQFRLADLYLIGESEDAGAVYATDWPGGLLWTPYGTFPNSVISRGTVSMKIGLEVQALDVSWSPKLTAFGSTFSTMNPYQRAQAGFYRNQRFRVWRTIMPTAGDANTYGAYQLFGGRVANVAVKRGSIDFTVNSFLDACNAQVPPNVIESTNMLAGYAGATPVLVDAETQLPSFTVVAPTSATNILATCNSPTSNKIYGTNKLQYGYLLFKAGSTLVGFFAQIASNGDFNAGGGVHYNQFIVYTPFNFAPTVGDTFYVSTAFPLDATSALALGVYRGFLYVPAPETAA